MLTKEKVAHIHTSESINLKMLVVSPNLNDGLMTKLVPITYENIYIGAEVRDLTAVPPIIGFIVNIEEYGWNVDYKGSCVAFSYFITIKNCDGNYYEFDLDGISINSNLCLVERE